jgi:hypothetical protein
LSFVQNVEMLKMRKELRPKFYLSRFLSPLCQEHYSTWPMAVFRCAFNLLCKESLSQKIADRIGWSRGKLRPLRELREETSYKVRSYRAAEAVFLKKAGGELRPYFCSKSMIDTVARARLEARKPHNFTLIFQKYKLTSVFQSIPIKYCSYFKFRCLTQSKQL